MRLIDADELIKEYAYDSGMWNRSEMEFNLPVVDVQEIKNAPTVDAEPVRHGHWRRCPENDTDYGEAYTCSVCSRTFCFGPPDGPEDNPYCSACGAKMEEEVGG